MFLPSEIAFLVVFTLAAIVAIVVFYRSIRWYAKYQTVEKASQSALKRALDVEVSVRDAQSVATAALTTILKKNQEIAVKDARIVELEELLRQRSVDS